MNARRAHGLLALGATVLLAHLWLANGVLPPPLGADGADSPRARFDVRFVRELAPVAVVAPAPVARPKPRLAALAAAPAASAALQPEAEAPPETATVALPVPEPAPPLPDLPELVPLAGLPATGLAAAPAGDAAASAPAAFEWPPSTRLSYRLTGNVRGPVEGQARVEWLRQGTRYQVILEASVGPSFAPLMTRRESSEGEITAEGLRPQRYDMEMDVIFRDRRRSTIYMDADGVRLPGGSFVMHRPPGLQDAVSQFVQLTWLFTTQPARLSPGETVELPLALPRRVETWQYDIVTSEPLVTTVGLVDAMHVRPRRPARAGDYTAEVWIAPSLQYLPVRIIVRQDAETYIDLQIERLPEQAEPGR